VRAVRGSAHAWVEKTAIKTKYRNIVKALLDVEGYAENGVSDGEVSIQAILDHRGETMKTSILSLALGIVLMSAVAAYPSENPYAQIHRHRTIHHATHHAMHDPFKPRITNGLSSNRNACASYGCVGAGGGGD
jgi:hypothetical protein